MSAEGNFSENGNTDWYLVDKGPVHIAGKNVFGGGSIAIQQFVNGEVYSALDSEGAAITKSAAFDQVVEFQQGDVIRLSLSSSTSPNLDWKISGQVEKYTPYALRI